jgi:hypothetical protein
MKKYPQIQENVIPGLKKLSNLFYASESNLWGLPQLGITDFDISDGELNMLLISISFESYSDGTFEDYMILLTEIQTKLFELMKKVSFDTQGNLTNRVSSSGKTLRWSGVSLVSKIVFTHKNDEVEFELDFMFN